MTGPLELARIFAGVVKDIARRAKPRPHERMVKPMPQSWRHMRSIDGKADWRRPYGRAWWR